MAGNLVDLAKKKMSLSGFILPLETILVQVGVELLLGLRCDVVI